MGFGRIAMLTAFAACVGLAVSCAKAPAPKPNRIVAGSTAPSFALRDIFDSSEIIFGKQVQDHAATVVVIWSMSCPTCRDALVACQGVYQAYAAKAVQFLGINFDRENVTGVRAFLKAEGIAFTNVWDGAARVVRAYKALDYSFSVFVVDRAGKVAWVQYDHPPDLAAALGAAIEKVLEAEMR